MARNTGRHTVRCTFPVLSLLTHGAIPWVPCPAFSYKENPICDQQAFESLSEHVAKSDPTYSYKVESSRVCRIQEAGDWLVQQLESPCNDLAATMVKTVRYPGETTLEMVAFVETTDHSLGNVLDHVIMRIHRHTFFNQDVQEDQLYDMTLAEWYCTEARSLAKDIKWWQFLERQLWRGTPLDYLKVLRVMKAQGLEEPYKPFPQLEVLDARSSFSARVPHHAGMSSLGSSGEAERCHICFGTFTEDDAENCDEDCTEREHPERLLGCGHVFGSSCILRWCNESDRCPLCRKCFATFDVLSESGIGDAQIQALLGVVSKNWTKEQAKQANDWWFGSQPDSQFSLNRNIWERLQATTLAEAPRKGPNASTRITYDTTQSYYNAILCTLAGMLRERPFLKDFSFAVQSTAVEVDSLRDFDLNQAQTASYIMHQMLNGGTRIQPTLKMSFTSNLREQVIAFADAAAVEHQSDVTRIERELATGLGAVEEWESFMTSEEPLDLISVVPMSRPS